MWVAVDGEGAGVGLHADSARRRASSDRAHSTVARRSASQSSVSVTNRLKGLGALDAAADGMVQLGHAGEGRDQRIGVADGSAYAGAIRLEAQALRYRAHDKLMAA